MDRLSFRGIAARRVRTVALVTGFVLVGFGTLYAVGGHTAKVRQSLTATTAAPTAHGKARLTVRSSKQGKFSIAANHLTGGKKYDVIVGGVKVGVMQTTMGGSGKASFSTTPGGKNALLGFDPRGDQVLVRDEEDGDDVLVGDIPSGDPAEIACCVSDEDGESECEEMSAAECTAAGGMPVGMGTGTASASCLPDPCATTPPHAEIVCCTNETHDDESEAECEDVTTEAECADLGGSVVQATSCDAHPCQVTPPADMAACCVTESDEEGDTECKTLSAATCTALGGTAPGAASCASHPCGGGSSGGGDDDGGGDGSGGDD